MNRSPSLLRLTTLAMLVAVGVLISPILRVEGMCPMAHLINIVCAVLLGIAGLWRQFHRVKDPDE